MSTDKGDSRVHPKASLAAELWVEHVGKGKCGQEGHHASPTNLRSTQWMLDGVVDGYRQPICGAPDLGRQDLGGGHPHQGAVANVEHEDVNLGGKWHHCCVKSSDYHGCDYGEKTKAIATALCQVVLRTIGHLNMTMTVNIGRMINMTMTVMMILHLIRRFHCNRSNCESRAYSFSPSHQSDDDDDDDHDNGNNDENGDDNDDDNDNGNNDGNDDGRWQLWLLPDSKGPWWRGWWRGQGCRSATSLACRRNHEICHRSHHFEDQTILQINQSDAQCEKVTLEVFQRWLESACSKQTKQTQPFDSNYQLIKVR